VKQYNHQLIQFDPKLLRHSADIYYPKSTVSVEMPEKIQLTNLIQPDKDKLLMLYVGVAICHPDDRFVKAEGRKVADSKLKPLTFKPKSLEYDESYNSIIKMVPISPEEEQIKELTFKVFSSSMKIYLIGAKVR
jgi:hypothetical protein